MNPLRSVTTRLTSLTLSAMAPALVLAAAAALSCGAQAQAVYPDKPIKLMVPWPAGGSSDTAARLVARHLQDRLKQPVVVENKPGASGNIGTEVVAKSAPDGYTLLLSSGPFSVNPSLYRSLPFNTVRDFTAIAQVANTPSVLVVHPSFAARTMAEFVTLARDKAKPLAYASPGNGTAQHLAMELLRQKADLSLTHVPYKGGAPALNDLLGGQVPAMLSGFPEVAAHLKAGRLRALAVTTPVRSGLLPDVPSLVELGLADSGTAGWNGFHAPAGTPADIVRRLNKEINDILAQPQVLEQLVGLGFDVRRSTPQEFTAFVNQQIERWAQAVAISGAKVD
jgi:tripartite-type tricarboxylate transporter receptor subunit TctC